ncbi:hypothetical protein [Streptomyces sp. NBC_01615]|uniref:hypothetical protein n=1 Tax=Streptomyces sp. NBC_01615 TaxID=2975898 RepID=UPI00386D9548
MVTEAVAASSWKAPRYRHSFNFISDLGVPSCGGEVDGRTVCSPLHAVMNTGFVVQGVLFVVAAVLLFRMVPGRLRWVYLALAVVHGWPAQYPARSMDWRFRSAAETQH